MRTPAASLLLALLLVPAASADFYEGKPDCPPDRFCTTSAPEPAPAGAGGAGAVGFLALGSLAVLAAVLAVRLR